jgi:pimeloyl-ACP methyl ester carboxylesterase
MSRAARCLVLFFAVAPTGLTARRHQPDPAPVTSSIEEVRLEVGDRSIRALCTGGARRVVLWHGEDATADTWRPVLERLDGSVGACAFDRPGHGGSEPSPRQRGWYELVDELRQIHVALGFERGYVLVAHSLAGLYARIYASDRPGDLGGLVLVEPAHEELLGRLRMGMPREEWERWRAERDLPNADGIVESSLDRRARSAIVPSIPVTVVTGAVRRDDPGWDARFLDEAARQVHASILRGASRGRHVPAERSGHDPQLDQPGLVASEVLRVVGAAGR